jgi:cell division septal protein FtsQ
VNERRVRASRQVYGRSMPLPRQGRVRAPKPAMSLAQRRLLIMVAVVGAGLWSLWQIFKINDIVVEAPGRQADIQTETRKLMGQSWMQQNLLTLNDGELAQRLTDSDPLLRSVDVRRRWLHGIKVSAVLKQPSMGWRSDDQQYLVDRDGTAIGVLPAGSTLPVVDDGSNLPVKVGQRVATSRFVGFVTDLAPALKGVGVGVTGLSVKDTTLDLSVKTDKGYRLIMDTSREVGEQVNDLKAVLNLLAAQKKAPAEYIDLRIAGKAYYK